MTVAVAAQKQEPADYRVPRFAAFGVTDRGNVGARRAWVACSNAKP
jgi:hypothetical protein